MTIKTEKEITSKWDIIKDPMVSISCITYNHEKYIDDAIKGFLMQETTFPFEILIHDDASTDNTAEIIKKYEKQYPNLIKPIYQEENQFSQRKSIGAQRKMTYEFNHTRAQGKYIAMCEGDDYWIHSSKLQEQFDFMENNNDYVFCFHNASVYDVNSSKFISNTLDSKHNSRDYDFVDFLNPRNLPTASYFYKKKILDDPTDWFFNAPVGDYALQILLSLRGKAHYMSHVMSVYRQNVSGSATDINNNNNISYKQKFYQSFIDMLKEINKETNNKYHHEIDNASIHWELLLHSLNKNLVIINSKRYKDYINSFSLKRKISFYINYFIPKTFKKLVKTKSFLRSFKKSTIFETKK